MSAINQPKTIINDTSAVKTEKAIRLGKTEIKILSMALRNDDRVQNHYSKEVFNCHYLSDYVSKLRMKLGSYFNEDGFSIIETETHQVYKTDGTIATIGIYRISIKNHSKIKSLLNKLKVSQYEESRRD